MDHVDQQSLHALDLLKTVLWLHVLCHLCLLSKYIHIPLTARLHREQVKVKHRHFEHDGPFTISLQCLHILAKPV